MQPEQRTSGRGNRRWQRVLLAPLVLLAALVFALEDWLWDPLTRLVSGLMRLPALRRVDVALRSLPPYAALAALLTPALVLLPLKFLGLALFARGHAGLGVGVFVAAKVTGTAMLAWLWSAVQPNVRRIPWASRWIDALLKIKARVYERVASWPPVARARASVRAWRMRARGRWRAWRAARAVARRRRDAASS